MVCNIDATYTSLALPYRRCRRTYTTATAYTFLWDATYSISSLRSSRPRLSRRLDIHIPYTYHSIDFSIITTSTVPRPSAYECLSSRLLRKLQRSVLEISLRRTLRTMVEFHWNVCSTSPLLKLYNTANRQTFRCFVFWRMSVTPSRNAFSLGPYTPIEAPRVSPSSFKDSTSSSS